MRSIKCFMCLQRLFGCIFYTTPLRLVTVRLESGTSLCRPPSQPSAVFHSGRNIFSFFLSSFFLLFSFFFFKFVFLVLLSWRIASCNRFSILPVANGSFLSGGLDFCNLSDRFQRSKETFLPPRILPFLVTAPAYINNRWGQQGRRTW